MPGARRTLKSTLSALKKALVAICSPSSNFGYLYSRICAGSPLYSGR